MSTSMEVVAALKVLGLEPPITTNSLKAAFRRCSKIEHPDHSKHPQAKDRFEEVVRAHSLLVDHPELIDKVDPALTVTEEGEELSNLGKGLGATVNGTTCEECKGLGYRSFAADSIMCPDCRTIVIFRSEYEYRCRKCLGTGEFKMRSGKIGTCYPCQGSGWVKRYGERLFKNSCSTCHGKMLIEDKRSKTYHTCSKCKGAGEIPMWNPVLPKGFLSSARS